MTPSPAPDRLTALIDEVAEAARKNVYRAELAASDHAGPLDHKHAHEADAAFQAALAALRAEAASVQERLARAEKAGDAMRSAAGHAFDAIDVSGTKEGTAREARNILGPALTAYDRAAKGER